MRETAVKLLGTKYPIIQGGMVWCSGWKLAYAVSKSGGLGVIGSGSMRPEILQEHLDKISKHSLPSFAVNLPLFYPDIQNHLELIERYRVPVVITSAGNPKSFTQRIKETGAKVLHVVANNKFTLKAIDAGVDGIIAEGFEAGGHNGREETTTMCLIPQLRPLTDLPIFAAGGISSGQSMAAAIALGADGVQVGSRFAVCKESSAHLLFKKAVHDAGDGDTSLTLKELTPVRLLKSEFYHKIMEAYQKNASLDDLRSLLGKGRTKQGIFHGDLKNGELEIGQVAAQLNRLESAEEIIKDLITGYNTAIRQLETI